MNRTLLYIVILIVLGAGLYFFVFNNNVTNPFGKQEAGFRIKDTSAIGKIFLVTNDGESILVERKQGMWLLNGKYKALPSMMNLMLQTLATQEVLYPVTEKSRQSAIYTLATQSVKVEVYDRSNEKMAVFYVGGTVGSGAGTSMLMEGAEKPYIVLTPGFNGSLRPRYSVQWKDWRDRTVFDIADENIKSVSVQYADQPLNSYTVIRKADKLYSISGAPEITEHLGEVNNNRAGLYLTSFTNVNCEGYLNGDYDLDSTIKTAHPMSVINIEKTDGAHVEANIFWMPINKRSKNQVANDKDVEDLYDADRLYALINNKKDTVIIQFQAFKRIFRKSYDFFEHGEASPAAHK